MLIVKICSYFIKIRDKVMLIIIVIFSMKDLENVIRCKEKKRKNISWVR